MELSIDIIAYPMKSVKLGDLTIYEKTSFTE